MAGRAEAGGVHGLLGERADAAARVRRENGCCVSARCAVAWVVLRSTGGAAGVTDTAGAVGGENALRTNADSADEGGRRRAGQT